MELIRGIHNLQTTFARSTVLSESGVVLSVGAFDGLHRGHQAVLSHVVDVAKQLGLPSVVMTLEPLPREYFAPLLAPARLMSFREKFEGLTRLGIDCVFVVTFNDFIRNIEATPFVKDVFVKGLRCKHIVVGDDFRFGRDEGGDFDLLSRLAKTYGYTVEATETQLFENERVSSTRIRQLLENADFAMAEKLLGRPYSISGKVVYGQQLGRTFDVPTANVELHRLRAAMSGVYAAEVLISGEALWRSAVANVGTRPTVDDSIKAILEVHLLDFSGDLYGKRIQVRFRHKIREEQKFDSIDTLKTRIHDDLENARRWFGLT